MTVYHYPAGLVFDSTNEQPIANASGDLYDSPTGTIKTVFDLTGTPLAHIVTNANGFFPDFQTADGGPSVGWLKFGTFFHFVVSGEAANGAAAAASAAASASSAATSATAAQAAQAAAQSATTSGIAGAPTTWPTTFPPSPHSHTAVQISDSSAVGRSVVTAADQQTARAAIGAGTGNGTSNLTLGNTATTAAPGNHTHPANSVTFTPSGSITATDVQTAIQQAAATGGSGGTAVGDIKNVFYVGGAYEALPATPDAAWRLIVWHGPVAPTPPSSGPYASLLKDWQVRA